jgi:hypothetical protein
MPFFPDSLFGVIYAAACFGVAAVSFLRNDTHARIVSLIFIAHWFSMRMISSTAPDSAGLWVLHDAVTVFALLFYGRSFSSRLSMACASLFFVVLLFDQAWWLSIGGFEANAAVAEAAGYLAFIMIAGASLGSSGGNIRGYSSGRGYGLSVLESRSAISGRPSMSASSMATNQNHQKKDRGVA